MTPMSTPPPLTADAMYAAAEHLSQSDQGQKALQGLQFFFDQTSSLDERNLHPCLTVLKGFSGTWPESSIEKAAHRLNQSDKGREMLLKLQGFFDRETRFDDGNARACNALLDGYFEVATGSVLDAVRQAAAKTG